MVKYYQIFILVSRTFINQLWLSVSSIKFYYDVLKYYRGYGIKYLFVVSSIIAMFYSIFILNKLSNSTTYINQIMPKIPEIYFDGNNISIEEETPYYVEDNQNNRIIVFDTNNSISFGEKIKVPIVLNKNKLDINLNKSQLFSIEYSKIFDKNNKLITREILKSYIDKMLAGMLTQAIFILPIILLVIVFITNVLVNLLTIGLLYFICKLSGLVITIQTAMRLVFFMSGVSSLVSALLSSIAPKIYNFSWILMLWSLGLLSMGINKAKQENLSKSY